MSQKKNIEKIQEKKGLNFALRHENTNLLGGGGVMWSGKVFFFKKKKLTRHKLGQNIKKCLELPEFMP